jgi:hypothetical protein
VHYSAAAHPACSREPTDWMTASANVGGIPGAISVGFRCTHRHGLVYPSEPCRFRPGELPRCRLLSPPNIGFGLPWHEVAAAVEQLDLRKCRAYIFHVGHAGSTLNSRLVGAHAGAFALREPKILRIFAQLRSEGTAMQPVSADPRLGGCLKLQSRTFEPRRLAVIKARASCPSLPPSPDGAPGGSISVHSSSGPPPTCWMCYGTWASMQILSKPRRLSAGPDLQRFS